MPIYPVGDQSTTDWTCRCAGCQKSFESEYAIRTHEVVFAAQQCYRTGRPVRLPLLKE